MWHERKADDDDEFLYYVGMLIVHEEIAKQQIWSDF